MLKSKAPQPVMTIEDRALEMAVRSVLDLNADVSAAAAYQELLQAVETDPDYEGDEPSLRLSSVLHAGSPAYLLDCINGYRAEFLDQFQQVRAEAIASLREEGAAVVIFNAGELNGIPAKDVESRLVQQGNELIDELAPQDEDCDCDESPRL